MRSTNGMVMPLIATGTPCVKSSWTTAGSAGRAGAGASTSTPRPQRFDRLSWASSRGAGTGMRRARA